MASAKVVMSQMPEKAFNHPLDPEFFRLRKSVRVFTCRHARSWARTHVENAGTAAQGLLKQLKKTFLSVFSRFTFQKFNPRKLSDRHHTVSTINRRVSHRSGLANVFETL